MIRFPGRSVFTRKNLAAAWLAGVTGGLAFLAFGPAVSDPRETTFREITVQRINIVEPDGTLRLVLANEALFPGLFMEGVEYRHHNRDGGGMLFFNDEGDEVGGMSFRSAREGDAYSAGAGLMFDQYKQDQTVGVIYNDDNGRRTAGLRVWDRPEYSIQPLMAFSDRAARAGTEAERDAIRAQMMDYAMAHGGVGAERFFAGKVLEEAVVRLADPQGRPRLLLKVGADGEPRIEFLDTDGKVVRSVTP